MAPTVKKEYSKGHIIASKVLNVDPRQVNMTILGGRGAGAFKALCDTGTDAEIEARVRELVQRGSIRAKAGNKKEQALLKLVDKSQPIEQWPIYQWFRKVCEHYFSLSFGEFAALASVKKAAALPSFPGDDGGEKVPAQIRNIAKLYAIVTYGGALNKAVRKIGKEMAKALDTPQYGTDEEWETYRKKRDAIVEAHDKWTPELIEQHRARILDGDFLGDPTKDYSAPSGNDDDVHGDFTDTKPLAMRPGVPSSTIFLSQGTTVKPVEDPRYKLPFRLQIGNDWAVFDGRGATRQIDRLFGKNPNRTPKDIRNMFGDGVVRYSKRENGVVCALMFKSGTVPITTRRVMGYAKAAALGLPVVGVDLGVNTAIAATVLSKDGTILKKFVAGAKHGAHPIVPLKGMLTQIADLKRVEDLMPYDMTASEKGARKRHFDKHGVWPEQTTADKIKQCGVASFAELALRNEKLNKDIHDTAVAELTPAELQALEPTPNDVFDELGRLIGSTWVGIADEVREKAAAMEASSENRSCYISELLMRNDANRVTERNAIVSAGELPEAVIDGWIASDKGWSLTTDANWIRMAKQKLTPKSLVMDFQKRKWELQRTEFANDYRKIALATEQLCQYVANRLVKEVEKVAGPDFVIAIERDLVEFVGAGLKRGSRAKRVGFEALCRFSPKKPRKWFIAALHKALQKLATEKGRSVAAVPKERTSKRCPELCGYIAERKDDDHTTNGGVFECQNEECRAFMLPRDADLDVGSFNIAHVALTGEKIIRPQPPHKAPAKKSHSRARYSDSGP